MTKKQSGCFLEHCVFYRLGICTLMTKSDMQILTTV